MSRLEGLCECLPQLTSMIESLSSHQDKMQALLERRQSLPSLQNLTYNSASASASTPAPAAAEAGSSRTPMLSQDQPDRWVDADHDPDSPKATPWPHSRTATEARSPTRPRKRPDSDSGDPDSLQHTHRRSRQDDEDEPEETEHLSARRNMDPQSGMYSSTGAMVAPLQRLLDTIDDASGDKQLLGHMDRADINAAGPRVTWPSSTKDVASNDPRASSVANSIEEHPSAQDKTQHGAALKDNEGSMTAGHFPSYRHASAATASMNQVVGARSTGPAKGGALREEDVMQDLIHFGVSDNEVHLINADLPSQRLAKRLTKFYWESMNWLRAPLPRKYILTKWEFMWQNYGRRLAMSNLNDIALLFATCAIAVLGAPLNKTDLDELLHFVPAASLPPNTSLAEGHEQVRLVAGRKMVYGALRTLLLSDILGMEELSRVMSFIQVSRFLNIDRRLDEAHAMTARGVRSALALGLHRDGTQLGFDAATTQLRRVVWSIIRWLDKTISFTIGRPSAIVDAISDTLPPEDVICQDEWPYRPGERPPCAPLEWNDLPSPPPEVPRPTCLSFARARAGLCDLFQELVTLSQALKPALSMSEFAKAAQDLDRRVVLFRQSLPSYFQVTPASYETKERYYQHPLDNELLFLPIQRFDIQSGVNYFRLALYRNLLLRGTAARGTEITTMRAQCARVALADIANRSHFLIALRRIFGPQRPPLVYAFYLTPHAFCYTHLTAAVVLLLEASHSTDHVAFADLQDSADKNKHTHRRSTKASNLSLQEQDDMEDLDVYRTLYAHLTSYVRQSVERWGGDSILAGTGSAPDSGTGNGSNWSTSSTSSIDAGQTQPSDIHEHEVQVVSLFLDRINQIREASLRRSHRPPTRSHSSKLDPEMGSASVSSAGLIRHDTEENGGKGVRSGKRTISSSPNSTPDALASHVTGVQEPSASPLKKRARTQDAEPQSTSHRLSPMSSSSPSVPPHTRGTGENPASHSTSQASFPPALSVEDMGDQDNDHDMRRRTIVHPTASDNVTTAAPQLSSSGQQDWSWCPPASAHGPDPGPDHHTDDRSVETSAATPSPLTPRGAGQQREEPPTLGEMHHSTEPESVDQLGHDLLRSWAQATASFGLHLGDSTPQLLLSPGHHPHPPAVQDTKLIPSHLGLLINSTIWHTALMDQATLAGTEAQAQAQGPMQPQAQISLPTDQSHAPITQASPHAPAHAPTLDNSTARAPSTSFSHLVASTTHPNPHHSKLDSPPPPSSNPTQAELMPSTTTWSSSNPYGLRMDGGVALSNPPDNMFDPGLLLSASPTDPEPQPDNWVFAPIHPSEGSLWRQTQSPQKTDMAAFPSLGYVQPSASHPPGDRPPEPGPTQDANQSQQEANQRMDSQPTQMSMTRALDSFPQHQRTQYWHAFIDKVAQAGSLPP